MDKFMLKNHVRMCVCCKKRFIQDRLFRLRMHDAKIFIFDGNGRSFYLCKDCINESRVVTILCKLKNAPKNHDIIRKQMEEIKTKWEKSD